MPKKSHVGSPENGRTIPNQRSSPKRKTLFLGAKPQKKKHELLHPDVLAPQPGSTLDRAGVQSLAEKSKSNRWMKQKKLEKRALGSKSWRKNSEKSWNIDYLISFSAYLLHHIAPRKIQTQFPHLHSKNITNPPTPLGLAILNQG